MSRKSMALESKPTDDVILGKFLNIRKIHSSAE